MRIGLIGLGRIGAFHADTLTRHGQVDQLFVTDAVPGMAVAAAAKFGATPVADSDELLALPPDGVLIASSTPTHLALLRAAVAAGIPTFCEKPVAGDPLFAEANDVDTASALLTFDDGTLRVVSNTRYNGRGYDVRLEVHGSAGTIGVGIDNRTPLRSAEPGVSWPPDPPYDAFAARFGAAYRQELIDFLAHVRGEIPNPCPAQDALEALYVAEAAQLSRDEGRVVLVSDVR